MSQNETRTDPKKCPYNPSLECSKCCVRVVRKPGASGLAFCPVFKAWLDAHPPAEAGQSVPIVVPELRTDGGK